MNFQRHICPIALTYSHNWPFARTAEQWPLRVETTFGTFILPKPNFCSNGQFRSKAGAHISPIANLTDRSVTSIHLKPEKANLSDRARAEKSFSEEKKDHQNTIEKMVTYLSFMREPEWLLHLLLLLLPLLLFKHFFGQWQKSLVKKTIGE